MIRTLLICFVVSLSACAHRQPPSAPDVKTEASVPPVPAVPTRQAERVQETQIARYTTLSTVPTESDSFPLAVIAKVHFPRAAVHNVGDAVRYLLLRSGYRMSSPETLDKRVLAIFELPLPDNQRVMGPFRVDTMLETLMGSPYQLVSDPISRTVTFALRDSLVQAR